MVYIFRDRATLGTQLRRDGREALRRINQEILHCSDLRLLAADTDLRAALAAGRLLALEAKHLVLHGKPLLLVYETHIVVRCFRWLYHSMMDAG